MAANQLSGNPNTAKFDDDFPPSERPVTFREVCGAEVEDAIVAGGLKQAKSAAKERREIALAAGDHMVDENGWPLA